MPATQGETPPEYITKRIQRACDAMVRGATTVEDDTIAWLACAHDRLRDRLTIATDLTLDALLDHVFATADGISFEDAKAHVQTHAADRVSRALQAVEVSHV